MDMKFKKMIVHSPVDGCGVTRMSFSTDQGYCLKYVPDLRCVEVTIERNKEWHNMIPMENIPQFTILPEPPKARSKGNENS